MRNLFRTMIALLGACLVLSWAMLAESSQRGPAQPASSTASAAFDPHDLTGMWGRFGNRAGRQGLQGGNALRDAGDAGIGTDVPPMTPEGQMKFMANRPGYGRVLGSPEAAAHPEEPIGRRRAVPPAQGNDPTGECTPSGLTRLILSTYFSPFEFFKSPDRVMHHFEWTNEWREIWTDGRQLPKDPDITRWNGYSVGRWEGDTFVVDSYGFEPTTWLDHFGYPHSDQMRLEERYRRTAVDRLELVMTINDPVIYTKPWVSQKKVFRLLSKDETTVDGWYGLIDDRCVPAEEFDFNKKVRDPAGGIAR